MTEKVASRWLVTDDALTRRAVETARQILVGESPEGLKNDRFDGLHPHDSRTIWRLSRALNQACRE